MARDGEGLFFEINGTEGDLRVTGGSGHMQMAKLSLTGARGDDKAFRALEVPESYRSGWPEDPVPGNVARVYARMARDLSEAAARRRASTTRSQCIGSLPRSRTPRRPSDRGRAIGD